ncbi:MAG: dienelactone hydrolase family protein [Burkholderiaceae bacterium]
MRQRKFVFLHFLLWCTVLLLLVLFPRRSHAQELVTDFKAGPPNGRYSFASSSPRTLADLVKPQPTPIDPVNTVGHLFLPAGTDKVPAVLLAHGSGGIYNAMLDFWPKQLNAAGMAVFALDGFGPRGVKSTAEDQSLVPFGADVADAFAALKLLASHPRIDPTRIAIMGFSRGGISTWRTGLERVIAAQGLPDGLRFAAHIPLYSGGCTGLFRIQAKPGVFTKSPMLWVHGDADDYTPIAACRDYAERIGKAGTPVEFVVIPGARHKFDMDEQRRFPVPGAIKNLETCPLEMDIDGMAFYDFTSGQRLSFADATALNKAKCSALGASVEGSAKARDKAAEAVLTFLKKTFAR